MNSIKQKCRPKHQVLILKCYPRFQKNAIEIKPNSSELSYLLYYADSRRVKLQKVGAFLDKKTVSDVRRRRVGNIRVTLQIISSLIEKCPRDLALYSQYVLSILKTILTSNDVTMFEESVPTFTIFCDHYTSTTLAADQTSADLLKEIVDLYLSYASRDNETFFHPRSGQLSHSMRLRYQTASLKAIKGLVSADSFVYDNGSITEDLIPAILYILYDNSPGYLDNLKSRKADKEAVDKEQALKRRQSVGVSRNTFDGHEDRNRFRTTGTTKDVDMRAHDEAALLALDCLNSIFHVDNRNLIRLATQRALVFVTEDHTTPHPQPVFGAVEDLQPEYEWANSAFLTICESTRVQDRLIILIAATDALVAKPSSGIELEEQLVITRIINHLLRSDVNFIGISIIDVEITLLQHLFEILDLRPDHSVRPHRSYDDHAGRQRTPSSKRREYQNADAPRYLRHHLIGEVDECISLLATHIYYSDQVGDMISTILDRTKPANPNVINSAPPPVPGDPIPDTAEERARIVTMEFVAPNFFSHTNGRLVATDTIYNILQVANQEETPGTRKPSRNRVDASAWDGSQWLLRDPDPRVRRHFVEALSAWLELELDTTDRRVPQDGPAELKPLKKGGNRSTPAQRALSNSQQYFNMASRFKSTFPKLLHLAIHDHALQYANSPSDILVLHRLLTKLVEHMGVNAVRYGLPMILHLQEEAEDLQDLEAKKLVHTLAQGYLWCLCDRFGLEETKVGQEILEEIQIRREESIWFEDLCYPLDPDYIGKLAILPPAMKKTEVSDDQSIKSYSLFESRAELIDAIAQDYTESVKLMLKSPPSSPLVRPSSSSGGFFSKSLMTSSPESNKRPDHQKPPVSTTSVPIAEEGLPDAVRKDMLSEWSREECVAVAERNSSGYTPPTGSGSGSLKRHLDVAKPPIEKPMDHEPREAISKDPVEPQRNSDSSRSSGASKIIIADLKKILKTGKDPYISKKASALPRPPQPSGGSMAVGAPSFAGDEAEDGGCSGSGSMKFRRFFYRLFGWH